MLCLICLSYEYANHFINNTFQWNDVQKTTILPYACFTQNLWRSIFSTSSLSLSLFLYISHSLPPSLSFYLSPSLPFSNLTHIFIPYMHAVVTKIFVRLARLQMNCIKSNFINDIVECFEIERQNHFVLMWNRVYVTIANALNFDVIYFHWAMPWLHTRE